MANCKYQDPDDKQNFMQQPLTQPEISQENKTAKKSRFSMLNFFLILLFVLAIIYAAPYILTPLAKNKIQTFLEKTFRTKVTLRNIEFNIFTGSVALNDLTIENPDQSRILQSGQIILKLKILPLLKKKVAISKIILDRPIVTLRKSSAGQTNWDFLWKDNQKSTGFPIKELLIKDGTFIYDQEIESNGVATAEFHGIFIHLKDYKSPIGYIQNIPLYTRIKCRGYIPTMPKGAIDFSANANLREAQKSFQSNISMDDISLIYFNNFFPRNSQIQVVSGNFSLLSHLECIHEQLQAKPNATVKGLQLKLTQNYETGDVFQLPVLLVVDFFDVYKDKLKITFEVKGTLSDPEFQLQEIVAQNVSNVIGESIVRTIAKSPSLLIQLGDKLTTITDKLKGFGIDIGKGTVDAIKQLEKPAEEFIKGLKGE